jgi:hypothetical protein
MGSRRLRPMTAADLHLLPEPCARCAFWEASLSDLAAATDHVNGGVVKAEWAEAVTRYWGYCGVMAFADDQPIGHLTLAPAMYVPRLGACAARASASNWCISQRDSWRVATSGRWRRLAPTTTARRACYRLASSRGSASR